MQAKIKLLVFSAVVLLCMICFMDIGQSESGAETGSVADGDITWYYEIEDNKATITKFTYADARNGPNALNFPSKVIVQGQEVEVVGIADGFVGMNAIKNVKSINIPATVEFIGDKAFYRAGTSGMRALESVIFDENSRLKTIGNEAFSNAGVDILATYDQYVNVASGTAFSFNMPMVTESGYSLCLYGDATLKNYTLSNLKVNGTDAQVSDYIVSEQKGVSKVAGTKSGNIITWKSLNDVNSITFDYIKGTVTKSFVIAVGNNLPIESASLSINLPDSVEVIGDKCFDRLASLNISENSCLKKIGDYSLQSLVTDLYLPKGLQEIGVSALPIKAIVTLSNENNYYSLTNDGSLLSRDGSVLIQYCGYSTEYVFPNSVCRVGDYAFKDNATVTTITIPRGLEWGLFPFYGATALTNVTFSSELKEIPDYLFGYSKIKSINIPSTVHIIGQKAFYETKLETVTFSDQSEITEIRDYAFCSNSNLTTITLGMHKAGYSCTIGTGSFYLCDKLNKVIIPEGCIVTQIGEAAFTKNNANHQTGTAAPCSINLGRTAESVGITIPREVEYIGSGAFSALSSAGSYSNKPEPATKLLSTPFYGGEIHVSLETGYGVSFESGSRVYTIGGAAFSGINGIESVDLSNCSVLNEIGADAFYKILKSNGDLIITMPSDSRLTTIGYQAFCQDTVGTVHDIVVPASVSIVGEEAFKKATSALSFAEGSMLKSIGGSNLYNSTDTLDLSNCSMLEKVTINIGTTLPAGLYEMVGNESDIVNANQVLFNISSDELNIGAEIIAINSLSVHGHTTITCDPNNQQFRAENGLLYMGNMLVSVDNSVEAITIDETSAVSVIGPYALKDSKVSSLILNKVQVTICENALNSAKVETIMLTYPGQTEFSQSSFYGNGCELSFCIPSVTSDEITAVLQSVGQVMKGYGEGHTIYIPSTMTSLPVVVENVSITNGVADVTLHVGGGYTVYDLDCHADDNSDISIVEGAYRFTVDSDMILNISPKDRTIGDMATVTFDGRGGTSSEMSIIQIDVPIGMTILDSEIPLFTKSKSYYDGVWLVQKDNSQFDFGTQIQSDLTLIPDWKSRGVIVTFDVDCGDVLLNNSIVRSINFENGSTYSFTLNPHPGYDPEYWCYVENGTLRTVPVNTNLVLQDLVDDITVSVLYTYYSNSSGLVPLTDRGMTTNLLSTVKMWEVGGVLDQSQPAWRGHSSVPLIVDNYIYLRISDKLYKVESDTGYVVKSVPSYDTNSFYHYLGYGNGMIIDYYTDSVYDTNLELLFTLDKSLRGYEYYNGYFWSSGTTLYRFPADVSSAVDGVMHLEMVSDFVKPVYSSYGFSMSTFIDGYIYRVYAEGSERGVTAMNISPGSQDYGSSTYVRMPSLEYYYLDDGWISSYNGVIYLGGYTNGLFGAVATNDDDRLTYVKVNGLIFEEPSDYRFDGQKGFISQLVVSDGIGFINAGSTLYAFKMMDDGSLGNLLKSEQFIFSHGSITVDSSYSKSDNGYRTYVYMIPYDASNISFGVMECYYDTDDSYVMNRTTTKHIEATYCSQAVRAGLDGQMIWYNDSGHVFGYVDPEKNPYYFFIDDGSNAGWYVSYGKNMYEAAKTLGSSVLSIDSTYEVSRIYGRSVTGATITAVHAPVNTVQQYVWTEVDSFANRNYDTDHYFIITANGATVEKGTVFSHIDGSVVKQYAFQENIGYDAGGNSLRSIIGVKMAVGQEVSVIRFYQGEVEIEGTAIIGIAGSDVSDILPRMTKNGYMAVWKDESGEVVTSLTGQKFPASGESKFYLTWEEILDYHIVVVGKVVKANSVSIQFDIETNDKSSLTVTVRGAFNDHTFTKFSTKSVAVDGKIVADMEIGGTDAPVELAISVYKDGKLVNNEYVELAAS